VRAAVAALVTCTSCVVADTVPTSTDWPPVTAQQFASWRAQTAGKVTVVNLWGSFCGPCMRELPEFLKLEHELADRVAFRFISVDELGHEARAKRTLWKQKMRLDSAMMVGSVDDGWRSAIGFEGFVPLTVVYGKDGVEAGRLTGELDVDSLRALVLALEQKP
jgi:thiol-disulfide isomerase/thioredoxin